MSELASTVAGHVTRADQVHDEGFAVMEELGALERQLGGRGEPRRLDLGGVHVPMRDQLQSDGPPDNVVRPAHGDGNSNRRD